MSFDPSDPYNLNLDKYVKAVERVLPDLPVENGKIRFETLWLETALPEDLLLEILGNHELELPPNVEQIISDRGKVLHERRQNGSGPSLDAPEEDGVD